MVSFNFSYHNIDLNIIHKKLNDNKKKIEDINKIFSNLKSLEISRNTRDLNEIKNVADQLKEKKDFFIVFGTGGSYLGARALINILQGKLDKKILFFDNIDPIQFSNKILELDMDKAGFIIISKSGYTLETLSQFSSIIEIFESMNKIYKLSQNCVVITENKDSPLKKIADKLSCKVLYHETEIGGRFSVFSNVGLFPSYIAGVNILKIREGAWDVISKVKNNSYKEHLIGAMITKYLQLEKNINLNVLMTYTDALYFFGQWYLQLLAESIGKKGKGITPIHSRGTTDQHSQLQIYLDGPRDKYFSIITNDYRDRGMKMNEGVLSKNDVNFLSGKKMGDLMYAEQQATLNTLIKNRLPTREIFLSQINEFVLGQLMAHYMMETIATCCFFDVDPFNQPAVELGKKLAKDYLSKFE